MRQMCNSNGKCHSRYHQNYCYQFKKIHYCKTSVNHSYVRTIKVTLRHYQYNVLILNKIKLKYIAKEKMANRHSCICLINNEYT